AGFATRYRELLGGWLALDVLRAAPPLADRSFFTLPDVELQPAETLMLRAHAAHLAAALVQVLSRRGPDWGDPVLVGMARLRALEASINSGRLVLLDVFPEDAQTGPADVVRHHAATLSLLLDERRADFQAARRAFFDADARGEDGVASEARWSRLEMAGNLVAEMQRAVEQHTALRGPLGRS